MTSVNYPAKVRWLPYGGVRRGWKERLRSCWWVAYTAGVAAVSVGVFVLAQALF